ncbi:hypothetical protein CBR_g37120 [Chara braunii]|uniref:Uncharacterized protein n=1 Tax=Chara braunii TaxID=69332 RepID=A0A388LM46_CHABU|nr:hypothetical protein CBR_g37120 [Chara braunii]|eukprot:GBG83406.1 hypothetical protein CBR_g37120 [Chara braunii]
MFVLNSAGVSSSSSCLAGAMRFAHHSRHHHGYSLKELRYKIASSSSSSLSLWSSGGLSSLPYLILPCRGTRGRIGLSSRDDNPLLYPFSANETFLFRRSAFLFGRFPQQAPLWWGRGSGSNNSGLRTIARVGGLGGPGLGSGSGSNPGTAARFDLAAVSSCASSFVDPAAEPGLDLEPAATASAIFSSASCIQDIAMTSEQIQQKLMKEEGEGEGKEEEEVVVDDGADLIPFSSATKEQVETRGVVVGHVSRNKQITAEAINPERDKGNGHFIMDKPEQAVSPFDTDSRTTNGSCTEFEKV